MIQQPYIAKVVILNAHATTVADAAIALGLVFGFVVIVVAILCAVFER